MSLSEPTSLVYALEALEDAAESLSRFAYSAVVSKRLAPWHEETPVDALSAAESLLRFTNAARNAERATRTGLRALEHPATRAAMMLEPLALELIEKCQGVIYSDGCIICSKLSSSIYERAHDLVDMMERDFPSKSMLSLGEAIRRDRDDAFGRSAFSEEVYYEYY